MKEKELSLYEWLALNEELNGTIDAESGDILTQGFLKQTLPLVFKYRIIPTVRSLIENQNDVNDLKNELLKKYGNQAPNGLLTIDKDIKLSDGTVEPNPKYVQFYEEYLTLLNEKKTLKYPEINVKILENIETNEMYPVLFSLIEE